MKYIKAYEEILNSSIKRYSIIEYTNSKNVLFIIELVNILENGKTLDIRLHYRYIKSKNKLVEESLTVTRLNSLNQYTVLLTSDNLEDCLNYINTIINQNKYNL